MIFVADSAKTKLGEIMKAQNLDSNYFVRVSVTSGGCSGLTYKLDFDNEIKANDQEFLDNEIKVVTDLKSFLYLCNTTLEFSSGLDGKGFIFNNPIMFIVHRHQDMVGIGHVFQYIDLFARKEPVVKHF